MIYHKLYCFVLCVSINVVVFIEHLRMLLVESIDVDQFLVFLVHLMVYHQVVVLFLVDDQVETFLLVLSLRLLHFEGFS